jgi:hypothetical protein
MPWPEPGGTDFASTITLTYIHNSLAEYPPLTPSKSVPPSLLATLPRLICALRDLHSSLALETHKRALIHPLKPRAGSVARSTLGPVLATTTHMTEW